MPLLRSLRLASYCFYKYVRLRRWLRYHRRQHAGWHGPDEFPKSTAGTWQLHGGYLVWLKSMNTRGPRGVCNWYCFSGSLCGTASPSEFLSDVGWSFTSSM